MLDSKIDSYLQQVVEAQEKNQDCLSDKENMYANDHQGEIIGFEMVETREKNRIDRNACLCIV